MRFYTQYESLVSLPMLIIPPALYAVFAVATSRSWPAGKKLSVKNAMRLYNVAQIVICAYMTYGLWPVVSFPNVFGISTPMDARGEWFILVHYLSKYLDWLDTVFIVVKGNAQKQLSFLHVYHHATIGVMWGILLNTGFAGGTVRYGALINSITHVLMYSHYLYTSFGLKNPLKALLTKWQIFQFYTCFAHSVLILTGVAKVETVITTSLAWLQFCYHITMIYLFTWKLTYVPRAYLSLSVKEALALETSTKSAKTL